MGDFVEDLLAFLYCTRDGKNDDERDQVCDRCGQALERDPDSGEYLCPGCDPDEDGDES